MRTALRFWLLLAGLVLPGIVLIAQQWSLGRRLASLEVHERDSRVRRAVDGFISDILADYRRQNREIHATLFQPITELRVLDDWVPQPFQAFPQVRARLGRPAALFVARSRPGGFEIRYFGLDAQDQVKPFHEQTLEPIHRAVLSYLHSRIAGDDFRERLRDNQFHESSEHWPFGVVHFLHTPLYFDDPVIPRVYVGMWESVDFAVSEFLLPTVDRQGIAKYLEAEGLDPAVFVWSFRSTDGATLFGAATDEQGTPILDVRLAAFGPLFEQLRLTVATREGHNLPALPLVRRQSFLVLAVASLWFLVGGVLLVRSAMHDRRTARLHGDFVGRVSHELRTPVAVALNAAESLTNPRLATPQETPRLAAILRTQIRNLASLLDRLMDVSRLEQGGTPIAPRPVDLAAHLGESIPRIRESLSLEESDLSLDLRAPLLAEVDPTAIDLIVRNMIENAVKYAGAGTKGSPPLELRLEERGDLVELTVRDHGPGLSRRDRRRVFRPFYRVNDGLRVDVPGHGLGLALVRALVDAHRGQVSVRNAPGSGCEFRVRLPRSAKP